MPVIQMMPNSKFVLSQVAVAFLMRLVVPTSAALASEVQLSDRQSFTVGSYGAYSAPWSTYPGQKNDNLVSGRDFKNYIVISPAKFPDETTIISRWPENLTGGVLGYTHIYYGNYDGGRPAVPVAPKQVRDIVRFSERVDYDITGQTGKSTLLGEFYLTRAPNDEDAKAYEIGILYQASDEARAFFQSSQSIGEFEDVQGRRWDVVDAGKNPAGATYIIFAPRAQRSVAGHIDRKAMLDFLVREKVIQDTLWVNGIGLGLESHGGASEVRIQRWRVDLM
jgi:hypothetical protein